MVVYVCTKFQENTLHGIQLKERSNLSSFLANGGLYLYKVSGKYFSRYSTKRADIIFIIIKNSKGA